MMMRGVRQEEAPQAMGARMEREVGEEWPTMHFQAVNCLYEELEGQEPTPRA